MMFSLLFFFFSSRRRHTRYWRDWSSDVCSSDLVVLFQRLTQALVSVQIGTSRHATGQEQHVGIAEIGVFPQQVGLDGNAVRRFHILTAGHANGLDVHTTAA